MEDEYVDVKTIDDPVTPIYLGKMANGQDIYVCDFCRQFIIKGTDRCPSCGQSIYL